MQIPSSEATDAGMMVDIPQPLSSRRISRTSVRNLLMGSDPGAAAAAGGLPAAGELRRAASGLNTRRISRTTSSRLTADQGVSVQTAESAVPLLQQQTASLGFSLNSAGVPMHVPGSNSRRTSRTLSGKSSRLLLIHAACMHASKSTLDHGSKMYRIMFLTLKGLQACYKLDNTSMSNLRMSSLVIMSAQVACRWIRMVLLWSHSFLMILHLMS